MRIWIECRCTTEHISILVTLDSHFWMSAPYFLYLLSLRFCNIPVLPSLDSSDAWVVRLDYPEAWALSSQCLLLFWIQYLHNTISWCTSLAPYMQRLSLMLMAVSWIYSVYVFDSLHHDQQLVSRAVKSSLWYLNVELLLCFLLTRVRLYPNIVHMIVCFCLQYLQTSIYLLIVQWKRKDRRTSSPLWVTIP